MTTLSLRCMRTTGFYNNTSSSNILFFNHQRPLSSISLLSQRRHASSSATSKITSASQIHSKVSSSTATTKSAPLILSKVNGPASTLPPTLTIPERKPNQSFFPSYAFALGKSYATFYKNGIKAIYANFIACRPIQAQLDNKFQGSTSKAIDAGFLDRSRFQLLSRSWFDVKRVPIFALMFLICGEFTPLVVIAFSSVVPYTCRIPKQIESDRKTLEKRRAISFRNLTAEMPRDRTGVRELERMQLLHISWNLGLSSSVWDWLGGRLPGLPTPLLRRKVRRRVEYLELDDKLIKRDGGVGAMSIEEIKIALMERGVDVLGRSEDQLRGSLKAWLRARDETSIERLLLTRPSVWPPKK